MSDSMDALVWTGPGKLESRRVERPQVGDGQALVRVRMAGICGSDISIYNGKHPRATPPLIMGHEFWGEVVEMNAAGSDIDVGDRVVCEPLITCGKCHACRSGYAWVCQNLGLYGIDTDGAFAEYVSVAADSLRTIPDTIPDGIGALVEPIAVAVHAVRLSSVKVGDEVCVLGAGPIGLLTAIVARLSGPSRIWITERDPYRIGLAKDFGFEVIDVNTTDPEEEIPRLTAGKGADVVFEVAGAEATVLAAPRICRCKGEVVAVAMPKVLRPYDIVALTFREITIKGVRVYAPYDFDRAIRIVSESSIDFSPLVSKPYPLDEGAEAFERARAAEGVMRVLLSTG